MKKIEKIETLNPNEYKGRNYEEDSFYKIEKKLNELIERVELLTDNVFKTK